MPEQLDYISIEKKYVKPLKEENEPHYSECEKRLIAYSLAWEGHIAIYYNQPYYQPRIVITNTEQDLLQNFHKIAKLGRITPPKRLEPNCKPLSQWLITSYCEILFFLQKVIPHVPSRRKRKVGTLVSEFCESRIRKHKQKFPLDYDERELWIVQEVQRLNKRGL